ncbi:MAG: site-specific integrase [Pseudonocardiaceae bacterium]
MTAAADAPRDLSSLVVCRYGSVVGTGDLFEPYQLVDADGGVVVPVAVFLRDLQACGRSASTLRSYGMDLLRWFRFVWAIEIGWDRVTSVEARDFCCWLQLADKPAEPHWRRRDEDPPGPGSSVVAASRRRPTPTAVDQVSDAIRNGHLVAPGTSSTDR